MDNKEIGLAFLRTKERVVKGVLVALALTSLITACNEQEVPCDDVEDGKTTYQAEYDRLVDEDGKTPEEAIRILLDCSSSELIEISGSDDPNMVLPTPEGGSPFSNEQEMKDFLRGIQEMPVPQE